MGIKTVNAGPTADVVFSAFGAGRISRLDGSQLDNPDCQALATANVSARRALVA